MNIVLRDNFVRQLGQILDFIALDSTSRAKSFQNKVLKEVAKINYMPFSYPKNRDFNDDNIRNIIYKKYKIPFLIDKENKRIFVIGIYKANLPEF